MEYVFKSYIPLPRNTELAIPKESLRQTSLGLRLKGKPAPSRVYVLYYFTFGGSGTSHDLLGVG